jgi:hypothetical protein
LVLGSDALEANLRELPTWSATFHVPDVVWYRDVVFASAVFLDRASDRWNARQADPVEWFPYPKGGGRLREFSLLSPTDLVMGRTLAGGLVERTEQLLPPHVFSGRLANPPPRWRFQPHRKAHANFRQAASALVRAHGGMATLDVSQYFPSLDIEQLGQSLTGWGCPKSCVNHLQTLLFSWNDGHPRGVPIGGEAFTVVGNAYLLPLDLRLIAEAVPCVRWMDDVFVFGPVGVLGEVAAIADDELIRLGLLRAEDKFEEFDIVAALDRIQDGMLTSVFDASRFAAPVVARRVLRARFMEHVVNSDELSSRQFRGLMRAFENRQDPFPLEWLARDPDLLNEDPIVIGDYLRRVPPTSPWGEMLVEVVDRTRVDQRDQLDARDLHLLRGFAARTWGSAEGRVFWEIAMDDTRRGPVRAWAMSAAARTPSWQMEHVLERVLEEESSYVRRSFLLSLRREVENPRVRLLVRHIRRQVDDLVPMAAWISR